MTAPTCACGQPSTQQVARGQRRNGDVWRPIWAWECDTCRIEGDVEMEVKRGG